MVVVDDFRNNVDAGRTHFDRVRSADGNIIAGYDSTGISSLVCLSQRARQDILLDVVHAVSCEGQMQMELRAALRWRVGRRTYGVMVV